MKKVAIVLGVIFLITASLLVGNFAAFPNEAKSNLTLEDYPQNATFTYVDASNVCLSANLLVRYYDSNGTLLKEYNLEPARSTLVPVQSRFYRVKAWQSDDESIVVVLTKSKSLLGGEIFLVVLVLFIVGCVVNFIREEVDLQRLRKRLKKER